MFEFLECGRTLQEPSGEFSSPLATDDLQLCRWRITATHGEKIYLNISNLRIPSNADCDTHYLVVADGHFARSPVLGV